MSEKVVPFSVYAEVNPPASTLRGHVTVGTEVSFVPMADVSESGRWMNRQVRRWEQVSAGFTAFSENDVIFAKITPCMENGKGALMQGLVNGRGYGSTEFHVLRAKDENSPEFVYQWCQSAMLRQSAEAWMSGSAGQQRVESSFFRRFEVPEISPDQQRRIASVLRTVDEVIEWTEARIEKQQAIKQGLLHDLFTRGLTPEGNLRPSPTDRPDLYQDSPLGPTPKEWEVTLLDNLAERGSGHTPNRLRPDFWDGGIKWVSLADSWRLDRVYISETEKEISLLGIANSSAVLHPPGIVVLSRDAGVGKSAITTSSMAVSQHFMCWRCGPNLDKYFLYYLLQNQKRDFENIAVGTTIPTIGLRYFKRFKVRAPKEVAEQKQIGEILLKADQELFDLEARLTKLRHLKSALMQDLLTGRVSAAAIDLEGS